ncbi:MAG: hypothetical protein ACFFCE_07275 [Promethearchaeota archaeon]
MTDIFKTLEVKCPICGIVKSINIPEAVFSQKKFGSIKIQVPIKAVCPQHQFIVFVDTKGNIIGYDKIDIQLMHIAQLDKTEVSEKGNLRNLIKIFGVYGILNLIHAKIFNYPTYILNDDDFEYNEESLNSIWDNFLPEEYRGNKTFFLLEKKTLNKIKIKDSDAFIMDTHQNIFQTPWTSKLKFEEDIIKRAIEIMDGEQQIMLLRQDIINFVKEVKYTISVLKDISEIYEDELIEKISNDLQIKKINNYRLNLIKEFIKRNISKSLASKIKSRVGKFLSVL